VHLWFKLLALVGSGANAAIRHAPSVRHTIDLGRICCQALRALPETMDSL
jgi:hypothetical protein